MKHILTPLLIGTIQVLNAATLIGTIKETISEDAVLFATINLYDKNELVASVESDFDGIFIITNIPSKSLSIEISFIGLITLKEVINFTKKDYIDEVYYLEQDGSRNSCYSYCFCIPLVEYNITNQEEEEEEEEDSIFYKKTSFSSFDNIDPRPFIYPNPTSDYIYIKNNEEFTRAVILDIQGSVKNKVTLTKSTPSRIDLINYLEGSYVLQLYKENELIKTEKVILARR